MSMLLRLFVIVVALHVSMAAWVDPANPVVKSDGNLNPDNTALAGWLNPEALASMGDSQMLDGSSFSWTPVKGTLAASSHVNGPMVKRNQANGFPVVRFNSPSGPGASVKFDAISPAPTSVTVFIVARVDLASASSVTTQQYLWQMGAAAADVKGVAVTKEGKVVVGKIAAAAAAGDRAVSASNVNAAGWHIYALDVTTDHVAYADGTVASPLADSATAFVTHTSAFANGVYQIGSSESALADGIFQGDIAEVCVM